MFNRYNNLAAISIRSFSNHESWDSRFGDIAGASECHDSAALENHPRQPVSNLPMVRRHQGGVGSTGSKLESVLTAYISLNCATSKNS